MPENLPLVFLAFVVGGFVKGTIGVGLPTVVIGILSLAITPSQAVALLVVPSFVTNVWQMTAGDRLRPLVRRLWPLLLAMAAGTWLGAALGTDLLRGEPSAAVIVSLGAALAIYAIVALLGPTLRVRGPRERALSPAVGLITGYIASWTGVYVIPAVPYVQALQIDARELVQALGIYLTVSTVALTIALVAHGLFRLDTIGASSLALLPAGAGMLLGQRARRLLDPAQFRRVFFLGLLALGIHLIVQGLR